MSTDASSPAHGRVVRRDDFASSRWLPGPHLPTIWASLWRRVPPLELAFERLELPDGDFVDLAWTPPRDAPLVIVLHGLEGSHTSRYARAVLALLERGGFRGVLMQFRGCGSMPNRLARSYHSGDTGDLAHLVDTLTQRMGTPPFAAIGYSLGGNVLLKWLGELGTTAPLRAAAAVSVPFDLAACADRLGRGFSRLYQRQLVTSMQRKYRAKFSDGEGPLRPADVPRHATFWTWDDAVTAPLHGFRDVHDYYARSSCRSFLHAIRVPTLVVQAEDDPFVPASAIPRANELGPPVTLELTRGGGHVAFIGGASPWRHDYWCEPRLVAFLRGVAGHMRAGNDVDEYNATP
ncbi:MAG: hydrolase [Gammaproteobacteria bacterium]